MLKIQSAKNILKAFSPKPWPLEKPKVIQFPVNDICNSKCQMCHIWKQKRDNEITPEELRVALRDPLYSEVTNIGINGGEPTLRDDLPELVSVLFDVLPKIKNISLITNGLNSKQVIQRIGDLGKVLHDNGGNFDVMVSLDGVGDVHDTVRGRPGNFDSACKVLSFVKQSPLVSNVRIGCTVIKSNVYGIYDLLNYARSNGIYIKYRLGVAHPRLYTENLHDPFDLSREETFFFCTFLESLISDYESSLQQRLFYRSLVDQLMFNKPRKASCDWQHRGATISSRGELSYCAIASPILGNIKLTSSASLYFSNEEKLLQIKKNYCDKCRHDYMGLPSGNEILRGYISPIVKNTVNDALQKLRLDNLAESINSKRKYERHKNKWSNLSYKQKQNTSAKNHSVNVHNEVMLCGWYGTETLGDKAILAGVVGSLEAVLDCANFCIASLNPHVTNITISQMPELRSARVVSLTEAFMEIKLMRALVFAGGPIMAVNELVEIEQLFSLAKRYGIPTLIAGCGVGPIGHRHYTESIKSILRLADNRIYRDLDSLNRAQEIGIDTSQDFIAEDPAFSWIHSAQSRENCSDEYNLTLILGLREWPYNQYASNLVKKQCISIQNQFEYNLFDGIKKLTQAHPSLTILPIPMCSNHYGGNDIWYYYKLFQNFKSIASRIDYSALRNEISPSDALKYFLRANVVLAMRFHSIVFSLGTETSTVVIDYTMGKGKVSSLAKKYDLPSKPINEIDSNFIFEHIDYALKKKSPQDSSQSMPLLFSEAIAQSISKILL